MTCQPTSGLFDGSWASALLPYPVSSCPHNHTQTPLSVLLRLPQESQNLFMICNCTQVHRSLLGIPTNRMRAYKQNSRSNKRSSSFFTLKNHYISFFHHRNSIRVPTTQSLNPEEPSLLKGKTLALLRRERGKKRKKKRSLCFILEFPHWRNKVNNF
jgi:hypothetical protein